MILPSKFQPRTSSPFGSRVCKKENLGSLTRGKMINSSEMLSPRTIGTQFGVRRPGAALVSREMIQWDAKAAPSRRTPNSHSASLGKTSEKL